MTTVLFGAPEVFNAREIARVAKVLPLQPGLFRRRASGQRTTGVPIAASAAFHGLVLGALAILSTVGLASPPRAEPSTFNSARLVFLATPGPGGGGGGGGLRQSAPPRRAQMRGRSALRSPV